FIGVERLRKSRWKQLRRRGPLQSRRGDGYHDGFHSPAIPLTRYCQSQESSRAELEASEPRSRVRPMAPSGEATPLPGSGGPTKSPPVHRVAHVPAVLWL